MTSKKDGALNNIEWRKSFYYEQAIEDKKTNNTMP